MSGWIQDTMQQNTIFALKIIKKHKSYIIAEYCLEYEKFAYIFYNINLAKFSKAGPTEHMGTVGICPHLLLPGIFTLVLLGEILI